MACANPIKTFSNCQLDRLKADNQPDELQFLNSSPVQETL